MSISSIGSATTQPPLALLSTGAPPPTAAPEPNTKISNTAPVAGQAPPTELAGGTASAALLNAGLSVGPPTLFSSESKTGVFGAKG